MLVDILIDVPVYPSFVCCCYSLLQGEGLAGAKVTVDGQLEATTDASGYYQLLNVTAGTYTVEV